MNLWEVFKKAPRDKRESFYSLRDKKDNSFTGISLHRDHAWSDYEMHRMFEAFVRNGKPPIMKGERGWLKKINDLIEELERKAK